MNVKYHRGAVGGGKTGNDRIVFTQLPLKGEVVDQAELTGLFDFYTRLAAGDGNVQWLRNRVHAKVGIEQWRRHHNEVGPHSSLAYLTPAGFSHATD